MRISELKQFKDINYVSLKEDVSELEGKVDFLSMKVNLVSTSVHMLIDSCDIVRCYCDNSTSILDLANEPGQFNFVLHPMSLYNRYKDLIRDCEKLEGAVKKIESDLRCIIEGIYKQTRVNSIKDLEESEAKYDFDDVKSVPSKELAKIILDCNEKYSTVIALKRVNNETKTLLGKGDAMSAFGMLAKQINKTANGIDCL